MDKEPEPDLTRTIHIGTGKSEVPSAASGLSKLSQEEREIVAALSPKDGMLIMHRGPGKGSRFLLTEATSIGRATDNDVFLDDVTVSRKHASISSDRPGMFTVKDLGSLNGTYVNGQAVVDSSLKSGDEIQIGKFHMLFFGGKS